MNDVIQAPIRLVISDIDGTLVTKTKVLTTAAIDAVHRLKDRHILFTITSSRPPRGMISTTRALSVTQPIAAFNGGSIVMPDLTVIEQRVVPADVAAKVVEIIESFGLSAWLFTAQDWFIKDVNGPHVEHEQHTVNFSATVTSSFSPMIGKAGKIVGVSDDYDAVIRCEEAVHKACGTSVAASRSQPYYLDITHPDANKGQAVLALSKLLNIPTASIVTIGDMPADVFMFKQSGMSIAMGNSTPEVQQSATFVTASNEEEGFAKAMERYVLPGD